MKPNDVFKKVGDSMHAVNLPDEHEVPEGHYRATLNFMIKDGEFSCGLPIIFSPSEFEDKRK